MIEKTFLKSIKVNHKVEFKAELKAAYPEEREDVQERIKNLSLDLAGKYKTSHEKVAHIVVTHGINVRTLSYLAEETTNVTSS